MKRPNIIIGLRPLAEAIKAGKEIEKVMVQRGLRGELFREVNQLARENGIALQEVPGEKLDSITRANHQGVIAFSTEVQSQNLENIIASVFERGENHLLLVLDGVTDVRNFGAICRTAECMGAHAVVVPERGMAPMNEEAIKSSAGAMLLIPICRVKNLAVALQYINESGIQVIAATEKGNHLPHEVKMETPTCIVMGNEEKGISENLIKKADALCRIPLSGKTSSLNVGAAAAMMLYEARRQRKM